MKPAPTLLAIVTVCALLPSRGAAEGTLVFGDDFSTPALLAEKWKLSSAQAWRVDGGALVTAGVQGVRSAMARCDQAGPIEARVRIKVLTLQEQKWCGVRVRGVVFALVPGGFWYVYNIEGKPRALGGLYSAAKPVTNRWYAFRIIHHGARYRWFVDGKLIADFSELNQVKNQTPMVQLITAGPPTAYDDVTVSALPEGEAASPNLLRNSSFESAPDHLPTPWIPAYIPAIPPEVLWRDWGVVDSEAFHGRRCLRLIGTGRTAIGFLSGITGVAIGRPCTFSVHLKADRPNCRARLVMWERLGKRHDKSVTLTTRWERHSFTLPAPEKNLLRAGLQLRQEAVVWADAAQLELGAEPSPYRPSGFDDAGGDEAAPLPIPPPLTLSFSDRPPLVDGKLDEPVWDQATKVWPLVLAGGRAPQQKTDAYMVFSHGVLYIGMRCHDVQTDKLQVTVAEHDGNVYADDSVEVFLDTHHDRQTYFHLAVNARGVRFDAAPGRDRSWNGEWSAKTAVSEGGWSAEIAVPLSSLRLTPTTTAEWGVNLCRHCPRLGEFSATAVTRAPDFHAASRFPTLKWPQPDVLKAPQIVPVDWMLLPDGGGCRIRARLVNRTGREEKVVIAGALNGVSWRSGPVALPVDDAREFSVRISAPPAKEETACRLTGAIQAADGPERTIRAFDRQVPGRSIFSAVLERSVYTREKQATIIADILLPDDLLAAARVELRFGDALNKTFAFSTLQPHSELSFAIDGIPLGRHPFTAHLLSGNESELGKGSLVLDRLPPSTSVVAIDRSRRCLLVDGQPYLVIAPLYQFWGHTPRPAIDIAINQAADSGFRTVMVVAAAQGKGVDALWQTVFDRCAQRGLKLIAWPHAFPKLVPAEFIQRWKSHPSLLAWMPIDEPELYAKPEDVINEITHFHKLDPYHPVYMNNTVMGIPSHFAGLAGDIVSIDDYLTNRPNRRVVEMIRDIEMMNKSAVPTRRPVWMFLSGNNLYNHSREPTAAEQVAQTYGCVLSGASGIKYFMGYPVSPAHWRAMKQTNAELLRLAPAIYSRQPAAAAECSSPSIRFLVRRCGSDLYLIAVNLSAAPVAVTFSLNGVANTDAVVLFEDRALHVRAGVLIDLFAPHQRHVYRLAVD